MDFIKLLNLFDEVEAQANKIADGKPPEVFSYALNYFPGCDEKSDYTILLGNYFAEEYDNIMKIDPYNPLHEKNIEAEKYFVFMH